MDLSKSFRICLNGLDLDTQPGLQATEKGSLRRHKVYLHRPDAQPFPCPLCPFVAKLRGDLNRHLKNTHKKLRQQKQLQRRRVQHPPLPQNGQLEEFETA